MRRIAALGIGGTNFYYAAGTESGDLVTDLAVEPSEPERLLDQIVDAVEALEDTLSEPVSAIAISCRGMVDHERGVVGKIDVNNGPLRRNVDLRTPLERAFDVPVYIENDCTAATLAEYCFGRGRDYDSIVHVTMGTGIGAGVVDRGEVLRGESNFAGEVGGIPVGPADGLEAFGIGGAWEAYCSGPGILEYVEARLEEESRPTGLTDREDLQTQCIFEVADDGDDVAREYLDDVSRFNAAGFGTIANLYNPGLITIGGGVAQNNREWILEGLTAHLEDFLVVDEPEIALTEFEDEIGIYGALAQLQFHDALRVDPTAATD